jgi:hypothetical protein
VTVAAVRRILGSLKEPYTPDEISEFLGRANIEAKTDSVDYAAFVGLIRNF